MPPVREELRAKTMLLSALVFRKRFNNGIPGGIVPACAWGNSVSGFVRFEFVATCFSSAPGLCRAGAVVDDALRTFASAVETAGLLSLLPLPGFRFFANGLVACTVLGASPVLGFMFIAAPDASFSNAF